MADRLARTAPAAAVSALCLALGASLLWPPRALLVWNASPSSPVGLYAVSSADQLRPGDMAIAWVPRHARELAARRHYLPLGVPLVKPVVAAAGARICARGFAIYLAGRRIASRRASDRHGRMLPWWSGCIRLRRGQLFLLSRSAPEAFDGRYFGVSEARDVIGKGHLLWTP